MAEPAPNSAATANRPRTRQRTYKQPPPLDVPNIDEDAAERKRVLNVLAQRRYREKKRLKRLKGNAVQDASKEVADVEEVEIPANSSTEPPLIAGTTVTNGFLSPTMGSGGLVGLDLNFSSWDSLNDAAFASLLPDSGPVPDFMATEEFSGDDSLVQSIFTMAGPGLSDDLSTIAIDPSSLDNTSNSSSDISFPDSYHLPVHELTLLRAMLRIADRIGCKGAVWSLDCPSPFSSGTATPSNLLPVAWRPTPSQVTIPHHPFVDFLPWPGVRDRILGILCLPEEMRPPVAAGPLGVVNFAYDVEHNSEGVRIYGDDPYDPSSWEVGQVLFERWWFLFDRSIIETSNRWRRLRGAAPLLIKGSESPGPSPVSSSSSA